MIIRWCMGVAVLELGFSVMNQGWQNCPARSFRAAAHCRETYDGGCALPQCGRAGGRGLDLTSGAVVNRPNSLRLD